MGSIKGRVEAFEEYIERRVAEDLEQELDAIVDVLQERLSHEEFLKMARIITEAYSGVR